MSECLYLGIDQGSSSTKGVLYSDTGDLRHLIRIPVRSFGSSSDRIEQDPQELLGSVQHVIRQAKEFAEHAGASIEAIGLSCQRSGVCAWNEQETLTPLYTWRNRMAIDRVAALSNSQKQSIQDKTFLVVLPEYAAPKIALLQDNYRDACVATLDSYLAYHLCDERPFVTDDTMASRTMLYSVREGSWDAELASSFGVSRSRLPEIVTTASPIGSIDGIPLLAMIGDGQAAVVGMSIASDHAVLNMGTVTSLCIPTAETLCVRKGFPSGILCSKEGQRSFFLEGLVTSSGSQTDYLSDDLGLSPHQIDATIQRAQSPDWTAYMPFRGSGSPDFSYDRPALLSSHEAVGTSELARAVIEHIAFSVCSLLEACEVDDLLKPMGTVIVSGGIARYTAIQSVLASCSNQRCIYALNEEASARGAAYLACVQSQAGQQPSWHEGGGTSLEKRNDANIQRRYYRWKELAVASKAPGKDAVLFRREYDTKRFLTSS